MHDEPDQQAGGTASSDPPRQLVDRRTSSDRDSVDRQGDEPRLIGWSSVFQAEPVTEQLHLPSDESGHWDRVDNPALTATSSPSRMQRPGLA